MANSPTGAKKPLRAFYPRLTLISLLWGSSVVSLITGLSLPLITVEKTIFWRHWGNNYSVFTGVVELAKHGDLLLAVVIFFFSMIFPFAKLFTLAFIWYRPLTDEERVKTLHWMGVLGKWSMLDVFAVAILIVAAKMRSLTEIQPQSGVYFFGLSIILAMLTTMWVDRLANQHAAVVTEQGKKR